MLESIDDGVGRIVRELRELGLEKNTLIIFTSDNGGETTVTSNARCAAANRSFMKVEFACR